MILEDDVNLTEENSLQYAICNYTNVHCHGIEEFNDDLLRIKYLKKLFNKFIETGDMDILRVRLALNHIIIFYNVFQIEAATRILFFRLKPELHCILKTFLHFLHYMPDTVKGINGKNIQSRKIKIHSGILEKLKRL